MFDVRGKLDSWFTQWNPTALQILKEMVAYLLEFTKDGAEPLPLPKAEQFPTGFP